MRRLPSLLTALLLTTVGTGWGQDPGGAPGNETKIASAIAAGPAEITESAAIMDWPAEPEGELVELRAGTNGWACMPDVPTTPGNDPMCLDPVFQQWAAAWQGKTTPELDAVGIGYMLGGGYDASNTDPFATAPTEGEDWIESGPHVMIVTPDTATLESLPTDPANGGPWVMWAGTPYAHVMVPVATAGEGHEMHDM